MYSDLYTQSRFRFTKHLAFAAVFVVVSTIIFLISQDSSPTRASRRVLQSHEVVNITPQQIGIFWETDEADNGWIVYGENSNTLSQIALDERDVKGEKQERRYHYALLKNIKPNTSYFYKIVSNNELIESDDREAFDVKTLDLSASNTSLSPIYGKILLANGQPAQQSFAMVMIGNAAPMLSMSGNTGEWLIPLQYIVNAETRSSVPVTEDTLITLQLFDDESRSMVRSTIGRSRPIPQAITLGNNYSFISESDVLAVQDNRSSAKTTPKQLFDVRFPKQGAVIPGVAPLIKGYGIANKAVVATINSKPEFTARVVADKNGEWNIPVRTSILPGKYILEVESEDSKGNTATITRDFTLIKSGERVLGEDTIASPSGSLTPSRTPSVIISTATPTVVKSPSPSVLVSPSSAVTGGVTATPAPPVSGMNIIPIMMAGVGMIAFGLGVMLLL